MEDFENYLIKDVGDLQSTPQNVLANFGQNLISIISFTSFTVVLLELLLNILVAIKGIGWIEYCLLIDMQKSNNCPMYYIKI